MDDTLTTVIPLRVSGIYAKRYRDGMTVRGGMTITLSFQRVTLEFRL
ncbi:MULTISPECIES: hypothetical protein [unclassified Wolbachia]|nr:hypothetical protein [Wolbachia endosymbiont (group A) of Apoderus coryli]